MSHSEEPAPAKKKRTKLQMSEILAVSKLVEADRDSWRAGTVNINERVGTYSKQANVKLCRRQLLNIVRACGIDLSWVASSPSGSLRASTRQRYAYLVREITELQGTVENLRSRLSKLEAAVY